MKILLDEKSFQCKRLINDLKLCIEYEAYSFGNKETGINSSQLYDADVLIVDAHEEKNDQAGKILEIKKIKPDIKTVMLTSEINRKYRGFFLSRGVDFFVFKESEIMLFKNIINQIYLRKTKVSY